MTERSANWLNLASWGLLAGATAKLLVVACLLFGPVGLLLAGAAIAAIGLSRQPPAELQFRRMGCYVPQGRLGAVLRHAVREIGRCAGLAAPPRLMVLPSRGFEVFTTGSHRDGTVIVSDKTLNLLTPRQLRAVLGHEIAHLAAGDIAVMRFATGLTQMAYALIQAALFAMLIWMALFGLEPPPLELVAPLLAVPTAMVLLQLWISRLREYAADAMAAALTGDPLGLADALERLERASQGFSLRALPDDAPVPVFLRTHPPTSERVRRLVLIAQENRGHSLPVRDEGLWPGS